MDPRNKTSWILLIVVIALGFLYLLRPLCSIIGEGTRCPPMCLSNLKQMALAGLMYAENHDDRLPLCLNWMDACKPYIKNEDIFHCPQLKENQKGEYGYAMDVNVSGVFPLKVKEPGEVAYLFDSVLLVRNACSGFYGFPDPKERRTNVTHIDGHVSVLHPKEN